MKKKQKLWFKRRRYGYGFVPVTWQGFVTVVSFLIVVVLSSTILLKDVEKNTYEPELGIFYIVLAISMIMLIGTSYKMGPKPKWRWGSKPTDDPELDY